MATRTYIVVGRGEYLMINNLPILAGLETIIPAGWTFDAMGAEAAALLGTGLVTGLVFLVLALRVGPKIVRAFKSIGR